jgi:hypothetical protein
MERLITAGQSDDLRMVQDRMIDLQTFNTKAKVIDGKIK